MPVTRQSARRNPPPPEQQPPSPPPPNRGRRNPRRRPRASPPRPRTPPRPPPREPNQRPQPSSPSSATAPPPPVLSEDAFSTNALRDALSSTQTTTPTSMSSTHVMSTPRSSTTDMFRPHAFNDPANRLPGSKTSRPVMDSSLYSELWDRVLYDVDSLWQQFDAYRAPVPAHLHDGRRWIGWPDSPTEQAVLDWFYDRINPLLRSAPTTTTTPTNTPSDHHAIVCKPSGHLIIKNGDTDRKTDLLVCCCTSDDASVSEVRVSWDQVRIVGELKSNPDKDGRDETFLQLANYIRELFGTQPQRRWALAFTLCGAKMRVFRFDRSGAVASTPINIHTKPRHFLAAMKAFTSSDATTIGFDPTIRWTPYSDAEVVYDPTVHFVDRTLPNPFIVTCGKKYRIYHICLIRRYAIATRGTVIWRAKPFDAPEGSPWTCVIKDQWRAAQRDAEGEFLAAIEPGTIGLPTYRGHETLHDVGKTVDIAAYIRGDVNHGEATLSAERPPHTKTSKNLYRTAITLQNRIQTRLVMSPLGQSLRSFKSYKHLLLGLRDAILGHRHMYEVHQIVHRDVSLNNILLHPVSSPSNPSPPYGFLIDFDFAIHRARQHVSGADFITGTFQYMASAVLEGNMREPHSPLEDLESFYYVLLDICINGPGEPRNPKPRHTVFVDMSGGITNNLRLQAATTKTHFLDEYRFLTSVVPTFLPQARCLRGCLNRWRQAIEDQKVRNKAAYRVTFDDESDEPTIQVDTSMRARDIQKMYDEVLALLEDTIEGLPE
ncbi:hypothetical protein FN846DRAFT_954997 [Sphaerosporella brunnea]|uniref:EKC/KEOPS complex subunit BUD32 n=1 Tax=Sphaerosporella brunnea TaxID=1250544 RepID=A0A5J5ESN7_9PEZI|nr:hypothetical protein FN846DRAFT_954997 [Sphaerosporella brunnea]